MDSSELSVRMGEAVHLLSLQFQPLFNSQSSCFAGVRNFRRKQDFSPCIQTCRQKPKLLAWEPKLYFDSRSLSFLLVSTRQEEDTFFGRGITTRSSVLFSSNGPVSVGGNRVRECFQSTIFESSRAVKGRIQLRIVRHCTIHGHWGGKRLKRRMARWENSPENSHLIGECSPTNWSLLILQLSVRKIAFDLMGEFLSKEVCQRNQKQHCLFHSRISHGTAMPSHNGCIGSEWIHVSDDSCDRRASINSTGRCYNRKRSRSSDREHNHVWQKPKVAHL